MVHTAFLTHKEKEMVEPVTGTGSIVGFTHGYNGYGYNNHHVDGLEGKDASFLVGNHTQDRITSAHHDTNNNMRFNEANLDRAHHSLREAIEKNGQDNHVAIEKVGAANQLATEKVGAASQLVTEKTAAANQLVVEKIGAANLLAVEKIGHANQLAVQKSFEGIQFEALRNRCDILTKLAECCCEIKEGQAATNALIRETESNRIKDDLAQCRAELLARTVAVPVIA